MVTKRFQKDSKNIPKIFQKIPKRLQKDYKVSQI